MTFTAVVTAHDQCPRYILGNLRYQTRKPDEILLAYSGDCGDMVRLREDFPEVKVWKTVDRQDWGHEKRAEGLDFAHGDVVGWFNADDSYDPTYVEKMMAVIESGADVAFCDWNEVPCCVFALGSSTAGNFVVRTDVGRKVGWRSRVYYADGEFINGLWTEADRIEKVEEVLYFHNVQ